MHLSAFGDYGKKLCALAIISLEKHLESAMLGFQNSSGKFNTLSAFCGWLTAYK